MHDVTTGGGHHHHHHVTTADGASVPEGTHLTPTRVADEPPLTRHLWIDASQGASGDMLLAALIDAGADAGSIAAVLDLVAPGKLHLQTRTEQRGPFAARKVDVIADEPDPPAAGRAPRRVRAHRQTTGGRRASMAAPACARDGRRN